MGGDRAPGEIVAGALQAVQELDVGVLLVGRPDAIGPLLPTGGPPDGVEVLAASEVVAMHDDPASSVRTKKDSSLVRAAEAVRDGRAHAMVGAGNTGATMASALLRCGRIKGVARPGIAVPIPVPGSHPQILIDGGATVDCDPEWLLQFARMGSEYARARFRHRRADHRAPLERRGGRQGRRPAQARVLAARAASRVRRQRRGSRPHGHRARRRRDRRLHRQRRAQDPRGCAASGRRPRVRRARVDARGQGGRGRSSPRCCSPPPPSSIPMRPVARCCSGSTGCA